MAFTFEKYAKIEQDVMNLADNYGLKQTINLNLENGCKIKSVVICLEEPEEDK